MKRWWGRGRSSFPALSGGGDSRTKKKGRAAGWRLRPVLLGPLWPLPVLREMMSKTRGSFDLSAVFPGV